MNVLSVKKTSYYHDADGIPNQDAVLSFAIDRGILGLIVSDGCSGELWSGVASSELVANMSHLFSTSIFLRRMERYLSDNTVTELQAESALFNPRYSKELFLMVCDSLKAFVAQLTEKFKFIRSLYTREAGAEEFATTMTLVFVQSKTGKIVSFNIGDSFACVKSFNKLTYIAEPENKGSPSKTYYITDEQLKEHLHLNRYQIKSFDYILVSTDGLKKLHRDFDGFLRDISFSPDISSAAVREMFLQDKPLPDDVGFLVAIKNDYNEEEW
ncbi:MAG: protein phosphatase 2C domain-containing protein [Ruminococcus sp.]|nr:protein phosphatase 2C domain-containing protein [Ruminococcus sp.]